MTKSAKGVRRRAVQHELTRRRRDALLRSTENPHPESGDLVDIGLEPWTANLADDDGLVDLAAGTAVRWVEGEGWIRESKQIADSASGSES